MKTGEYDSIPSKPYISTGCHILYEHVSRNLLRPIVCSWRLEIKDCQKSRIRLIKRRRLIVGESLPQGNRPACWSARNFFSPTLVTSESCCKAYSKFHTKTRKSEITKNEEVRTYNRSINFNYFLCLQRKIPYHRSNLIHRSRVLDGFSRRNWDSNIMYRVGRHIHSLYVRGLAKYRPSGIVFAGLFPGAAADRNHAAAPLDCSQQSLAAVYRDLGRQGPLRIMDENLTERVAAAFSGGSLGGQSTASQKIFSRQSESGFNLSQAGLYGRDPRRTDARRRPSHAAAEGRFFAG